MDFSLFIRRKGLAQQLTPDEILDAFDAYLKHNETDGIWWVSELVRMKDGPTLASVPHRVPLTTKAFCVFAGMSHATFLNYLNPASPTYEAYHVVAEYIRDICAVNIFNGAAIGVFNGNLAAGIIKRDFGIEEQESTDPRNVKEIHHEVIFTDFTDVTLQLDSPPPMAYLPIPGRTTLQQDMDSYTYDNMPNTSSRHDNMQQYIERNGQTEE